MAVWILNHEAQVSIPAGVNRIRDLDAVAGQVIAQLLGIRSFERDVRKPVFCFTLELRKHFNVLMIVYLEIGQKKPASGFVEGEWFREPEIAPVEIPRGRQIVGLQT